MKENDIKENVENIEEENKPYQVAIEDARQALFKDYSKSRKISNILMFVILAMIVGIMFMIMNNNQVLKIVGYSLAGALVIGMIVYYVLTKKKFPNKTKDYITFVSTKMRNRMFDEKYDEVKCDVDEKFKIEDFVGDGVYRDATNINSRNVIRAEYKGHHITYGEAALLRPYNRKQQVPPLFVGKYVSMPNDLEFDGHFVLVYRNPKQPLDLPNAIDDLVVLEEKEDMIIYGPEGADYHNVLKGSLVSDLRRLELNQRLLNVNIAIWAGHSAAYLSYDDSVMSFPFDKPFRYEDFEQSCKDFDAVVRLLAGE